MKLWGGRFTKATDKSVEEFNASIQFDCRMYAEDICGSIAHATMLAKQGIISQEDKDAMDGEQAQIETWNDVVASVYELLK